MAQRGKEWLAPMLFEANCTHRIVTDWIEHMLLKQLNPNSLIVMDNAPVHNKKDITTLLQKHGHQLLSLPPYSPDLNPIEQSFAVLKKRKIFSNKTLDELLLGNLAI